MQSPGIAVVVNLHARRGSEAIATACRRELPGARVLASRTLDEARGFTRELVDAPPDVVVSAGGDGTAVALINALRGGPAAQATIACLRLGTGNGWAREMGAPEWRRAIGQLGAWRFGSAKLPRRRFDLVEVDGSIAHYAGTGWDAEILEDFHAQKAKNGLLPDQARRGLPGYLSALATRTIPRALFGRAPRVEVELTNTGEDAIAFDDDGKPFSDPRGRHGALLYRGPISVCGAGTTPQWGFEFRAFPFAGTVKRRFCMRAYGAGAIEAVRHSRSLWLGRHPIPKMHTWMLTKCRAVFSREVPFQIGGDRVGQRSEVEYRLAEEQVDLLEWRRMHS